MSRQRPPSWIAFCIMPSSSRSRGKATAIRSEVNNLPKRMLPSVVGVTKTRQKRKHESQTITHRFEARVFVNSSVERRSCQHGDERRNCPPSHSEYGPYAGPVPSHTRHRQPRDGGFFKAWEDKKNDGLEKEKALSPRRKQSLAVILSALTWLSLVGLHPCRAQLRFTRQHSLYFKLQGSAQHRQTGSPVAQNLTARNVHLVPKPAEPDHRLRRPNRRPERTMMP